MNVQSEKTLHSLFQQWKDEDQELERYIDDVRDWMADVSQLGIPRFGETANRLKSLLDRLTDHFDREDEIIAQLAELYAPDSVEVSAARRQASRDHRLLSDRLGDLVSRLDQLEPPFASWESAMDEVELFVVALEQHEDQEAESVEMLIPHQSDC